MLLFGKQPNSIVMKGYYIFAGIMLFSGVLTGQSQETPQQKQMAEQMAKYMDAAWEAQPETGKSNLRILMTKNGHPYEGVISIHAQFSFRTAGISTFKNHHTNFNPNKNGRWVMEGLEPDTYNITIEGTGDMADFIWQRSGFKIEPNSSPVIEVTLED